MEVQGVKQLRDGRKFQDVRKFQDGSSGYEAVLGWNFQNESSRMEVQDVKQLHDGRKFQDVRKFQDGSSGYETVSEWMFQDGRKFQGRILGCEAVPGCNLQNESSRMEFQDMKQFQDGSSRMGGSSSVEF